MKSMLPAWPQFNPKTIGRVTAVLKSGKVNYWTGPVGAKFESAFAKWVGVRNAVSVSNGTAALHLALEAEAAGEERKPVSAKTAGAENLGGLSAAFDNAFANVEWQPGEAK